MSNNGKHPVPGSGSPLPSDTRDDQLHSQSRSRSRSLHSTHDHQIVGSGKYLDDQSVYRSDDAPQRDDIEATAEQPTLVLEKSKTERLDQPQQDRTLVCICIHTFRDGNPIANCPVGNLEWTRRPGQSQELAVEKEMGGDCNHVIFHVHLPSHFVYGCTRSAVD